MFIKGGNGEKLNYMNNSSNINDEKCLKDEFGRFTCVSLLLMA